MPCISFTRAVLWRGPDFAWRRIWYTWEKLLFVVAVSRCSASPCQNLSLSSFIAVFCTRFRRWHLVMSPLRRAARRSSMISSVHGCLGVRRVCPIASAAAWFIVDVKRFQLMRSSFARAFHLLEMDQVSPEATVGSRRWEDLSRGGFHCDRMVFSFSLSWATSNRWSVLPNSAPRYTRQLLTLDFQRLEIWSRALRVFPSGLYHLCMSFLGTYVSSIA